MVQVILDIAVDSLTGLWALWTIHRLLRGKKPPTRTALISALAQFLLLLAVTRRPATTGLSQGIWLAGAGLVAVTFATAVLAWPRLAARKSKPLAAGVNVAVAVLCLGFAALVL